MSDSLLDRYAAIVCDLDGVVYRGPEAVEYAVESLAGLPLPVMYATNNASRPPRLVAEHLWKLGLHVAERDIVTSSQAGAAALAHRLPPGVDVLAVGGAGVGEALQHCGFRVIVPDDTRSGRAPAPAAVLQGYGSAVTAADLAEAAHAVQAGALWVATNTDTTLPTDRGLIPGNGTLVAAVREATGSEPIVVGKPQAPLYLTCAERLGRPPRTLLAVGDRLDTDIAGAFEAGMDSVLVLTGVDSISTVALAPKSLRPTYVVEDLRALGDPYLAAETDYTWWSCGADSRRIIDGRWLVRRQGAPIEAARAGIAALHEALDLGELDQERAQRLVLDIDRWQ